MGLKPKMRKQTRKVMSFRLDLSKYFIVFSIVLLCILLDTKSGLMVVNTDHLPVGITGK